MEGQLVFAHECTDVVLGPADQRVDANQPALDVDPMADVGRVRHVVDGGYPAAVGRQGLVQVDNLEAPGRPVPALGPHALAVITVAGQDLDLATVGQADIFEAQQVDNALAIDSALRKLKAANTKDHRCGGIDVGNHFQNHHARRLERGGHQRSSGEPFLDQEAQQIRGGKVGANRSDFLK